MHDKYSYRINWDNEAAGYVGTCLEFPSLWASGTTGEFALEHIKETVSAKVATMKSPPTPLALHRFSGKVHLRMPPEKHRRLVLDALEQGVSMNTLINSRV